MSSTTPGPSHPAASCRDRDDASLREKRLFLLLYFVIALPVLLWIVLSMAPFQGPDEAEHYMRAVQISEGHILPVASPSRRQAGDYLDTQIGKLGGYYEYRGVHSTPAFKAGDADWKEAWLEPLSQRRVFTPFSNTVIYFPLAYFAPSAAIAVTRPFDSRPLAWLFAGRIAGAFTALALTALALILSPQTRCFVLVYALLPRVLFQEASLSADGLLLPLMLVFIALLARLTFDRQVTPTLIASVATVGFSIAIIKLAYLLFGLLPPAILLCRDRRLSNQVWALAIASLGTVVMWLVWMALIRETVFPIRSTHLVDVQAQKALLIHAPLHFLSVIKNTLWGKQLLFDLSGMTGGDIAGPGSYLAPNASLPSILSFILLFMLALSGFVSRTRRTLRPVELTVISIVSAASILLILASLYIQNTEVGYKMVQGFQGRYFLPCVALIAIYLPKRNSLLLRRVFLLSATIILGTSSLVTVDMFKRRYWSAQQDQKESFKSSKFQNLDYP